MVLNLRKKQNRIANLEFFYIRIETARAAVWCLCPKISKIENPHKWHDKTHFKKRDNRSNKKNPKYRSNFLKRLQKKIVNNPYATRNVRVWHSRKRVNLYPQIVIKTENQTLTTEMTIKTMWMIMIMKMEIKNQNYKNGIGVTFGNKKIAVVIGFKTNNLYVINNIKRFIYLLKRFLNNEL